MASGELLMSSDPEALKKKLLKPPNERQRQETLGNLNIVNTSQDDPYYNNIVNLVRFSIPHTPPLPSPQFVPLRLASTFDLEHPVFSLSASELSQVRHASEGFTAISLAWRILEFCP